MAGDAFAADYQRTLNQFRQATEDRPWPDPLSKDAFIGLAGDVVRTIEPHTESDPVALLVQFLSAFGSLVGRGPHYLVEGDEHHGNLFAVLVGQSSKARKGTAWSRIRQIFEILDDDWSKQCVHSGLSSGEGLIWQVRDASSDADPGIDDKRLLILESEFANILRVMTRDGNTLSRVIRDAWDRGNLATMTKNSPAVATGAHISIVGHITADELRRYLDRTEAANGFANRFIYLCVQRARLLPHGGALGTTELRPLARQVAERLDFARGLGRITMAPDTAHVWESVYEPLSEGKPGLTGSITGRAEAQVIRIATLYAMLDGNPEIEVPHLMAGLAIWRYAEASAAYVFGQTFGDPTADKILEALRAAPAGMTRTAISRLFQRNKSAAQITAALETLAVAGKAISETEQSEGRPIERWMAA